MRAAGATVLYIIPDECRTWREAVRYVRHGDTVLIQWLQLLPEPKSAKVRFPAMDGRDAIEEIEKRGATLVEVGTGRSIADPKQRAALIADMAKSVGAGGRSLSSAQARANGAKALRRGRRKAEFPPGTAEKAEQIWHSRKVATWAEAAALLEPLGYSIHRAHKEFGKRGK